jgi:hypothetical protein
MNASGIPETCTAFPLYLPARARNESDDACRSRSLADLPEVCTHGAKWANRAAVR